MKFKFCSDADCPLWALAALHALGSLPSPLFKALLQHIVSEEPEDGIMEILKDTMLSSRDECARAAGVLRWTLNQAHRSGCSGGQLMKDLLLLGVPRSHAAALGEAADASRPAYEAQMKSSGGFISNRLTDVSLASAPEGSVDVIKLVLHSEETVTGKQNTSELLIDKDQARILLKELKGAHAKMVEIEKE